MYMIASRPRQTPENGVHCGSILGLIYSRCKTLLPFLGELRRCGAYTRPCTPVFAPHSVPCAVLPLFMQATSVKTLPCGWIVACTNPGYICNYSLTLSGTTSLPSFASHLSQTILCPRMPCGRDLQNCSRSSIRGVEVPWSYRRNRGVLCAV